MVASIGLIVLAPVFLTISFILFFYNRESIFFIQERPGRNLKIFNIYKFKTMNDKKDELGMLLPDFKRMTTIGSFLRDYSLDELPQLINVLRGDMSLVGPRPLLQSYISLYNDFQKRRHELKPGITGWAQVKGRNAISWQQKFELDVWYIDNCSFFLDVKIFWLTLFKVIKRSEVNASVSKTMTKFTGNTTGGIEN